MGRALKELGFEKERVDARSGDEHGVYKACYYVRGTGATWAFAAKKGSAPPPPPDAVVPDETSHCFDAWGTSGACVGHVGRPTHAPYMRPTLVTDDVWGS